MKTTRKQLRNIIKQVLLEAFNPYDPNQPIWGKTGDEKYKILRNAMINAEGDWPKKPPADGNYPEVSGYNQFLRRSGLITPDQYEKELQIIADYQQIYAEEISKFENAIENGKVICVHAIDFDTAANGACPVKPKRKIEKIAPWIKNYGGSKDNRNKTQISTVMMPAGLENLGNINWFGNRFHEDSISNFDTIKNSYACVMLKGRPLIMNSEDMSTQTISFLPPEYVDYQTQNSGGIKKTFEKTPDITNFEEFMSQTNVSGETILEDWYVTGVFKILDRTIFNPAYSWCQGYVIENEIPNYQSLLKFCKDSNLPFYCLFKDHFDDSYAYFKDMRTATDADIRSLANIDTTHEDYIWRYEMNSK